MIFTETGGYHVSPLTLTGEHAGRTDVLADNLPALHENLTPIREGRF